MNYLVEKPTDRHRRTTSSNKVGEGDGKILTFDASEVGFEVRLEVNRADARRRKHGADVDDLTAMATGALSGQYISDVSAAADEAVVLVDARVRSHATVARTDDSDHLVAGTLHVQLVFQAVVHR